MIPLFLLRRPKMMLIGSVFIASAIILGLLIWRNSYLADKAASQSVAIAGFEKVVRELQKDVALRDGIARRDSADSLNNEHTRADIIGEIESAAKDQDGACAPVLCDNVKRLLNDATSTKDN